jgi:hypothetical protein
MLQGCCGVFTGGGRRDISQGRERERGCPNSDCKVELGEGRSRLAHDGSGFFGGGRGLASTSPRDSVAARARS